MREKERNSEQKVKEMYIERDKQTEIDTEIEKMDNTIYLPPIV